MGSSCVDELGGGPYEIRSTHEWEEHWVLLCIDGFHDRAAPRQHDRRRGRLLMATYFELARKHLKEVAAR